MQASIAKRKRHTTVEIATKLAQANHLATRGKLRSEIARTLGVSVMTLHRWRKAPRGPQPALEATPEGASPIACAAPTTESPNSRSKIHGCVDW
jgi:transposase-like protein